MSQKKYLFISRKSSHFRYYQKLVAFLGEQAELKLIKRWALPRLRHWSQVAALDLNGLIDVHIKRKVVRHPKLFAMPFVLPLAKCFFGLLERSRATYYYALFSSIEHSTIVLWNGMKQPNKTPYEVAKLCGKHTLLFENGLLPNTTVLDPIGVNALNSVPRDPEFYRNHQFGPSSLTEQLVAREPHKHRKAAASPVQLPERFIFVPFQVPNDTQIVCHSPWIDSMESFYQVIEQAVTTASTQSEGLPFKVVIKEHPSWPRSFKHLHHRNPNIVFANEANTQELIEQALAVVTINSTVGVEGLLLGKKVITLGNSFINVPGVVWHADNVSQLVELFVQLESLNVDHSLISNFLNYLQNHYLIPDAWQKISSESHGHLDAVHQRLKHSFQPLELSS